MPALAGAVGDPGQYNKDVKGRVARGLRTTASATTTTEAEMLRLDSVPVLAGHTYTIATSTMSPFSTVANDYIASRLRYTTDGTTPTVASTLLIAAQSRITGASGNESSLISVTYNPAADGIISLLLTIARSSGTGNVSVSSSATNPIELWISHDGEDPGNTGVPL
jgi:hypothetical protein